MNTKEKNFAALRPLFFSTLLILILLNISGKVIAQETTEEEMDIFDMSLEELLNVDISAASKKSESQLEAPGIVSVVPKDEFIIYGDRNLHQLMQRQPSVYTRHSFVYSDNMAAFRGDMSTHAEMHTLILFNGRPIRESAQGHNVNMYTTFPLATLESVELIRGPGSVLYGSNAFTGLVNLKTRPVPDSNEFSFSSMVGSYGYYETDIYAGGRYGELGYITAARTAGQHGYRYSMIDALGAYGSDRKNHQSFSGAAHLEYRGLTFDFFGSDIENFSLGVTPFWSNSHSYIRNKKLFANLGYQIPMHERMTLELNATYNLQENSLSSPAPTMIGTNTSDFLAEATLFTNPLDNMNFVFGYLQEYRRNYKPDNDHFQSIPSYNHEPISAYAQGDYKIDDSLKLITGTQWNKSSQGHSDFVSRYGIIFTPHEKWGIKLLRGEAFRAPVTLESDLYDPGAGLVGNDDLKPEIITTYDAQLFYQDKKTYAAATYFNSEIDKLILYDYSVAPTSYMNGGEQKFDGIEFEAKRILTSKWHMLGSFMYQNNKTDIGLNPSVVPEKIAKLGTAYTWDEGSVSLFYTHFGNPPDIASAVVVNPEPESINLVSLNIRTDISEQLEQKKGQTTLILRAENILNEKIYVPTFAYTGAPNSFPYGPGITFYCGLQISF